MGTPPGSYISRRDIFARRPIVIVRGIFAARGRDAKMIEESRLRRMHFRAWHRGTKEADLLIGGFFDAHGRSWSEAEADLFETLMDEQDVDIMSWAIGTLPCPARYEGVLMQAMRALDYIPIAK